MKAHQATYPVRVMSRLLVGAVWCERVSIDFPVKQGTFREFGQLDPRIRPLHSD